MLHSNLGIITQTTRSVVSFYNYDYVLQLLPFLLKLGVQLNK